MVEICWILEINSKADSLRKSWNTYVINKSSGSGGSSPPVITPYYQGSEDGVVLMDVEFDPSENPWSEEGNNDSWLHWRFLLRC
ncbi:MAG: hypothetical protein AAGA18_08975 [Verrucomicrobiota bacterium]